MFRRLYREEYGLDTTAWLPPATSATSPLTDLFYRFAKCGSLATISVDTSWAQLLSGISSMEGFYNRKSLVGSYGAMRASSTKTHTYFSIDTAGAPGCITVV